MSLFRHIRRRFQVIKPKASKSPWYESQPKVNCRWCWKWTKQVSPIVVLKGGYELIFRWIFGFPWLRPFLSYDLLVWTECLYFYNALSIHYLERITFSSLLHFQLLSDEQSSYVAEFLWIPTHFGYCKFFGYPRCCKVAVVFIVCIAFPSKTTTYHFSQK